MEYIWRVSYDIFNLKSQLGWCLWWWWDSMYCLCILFRCTPLYATYAFFLNMIFHLCFNIAWFSLSIECSKYVKARITKHYSHPHLTSSHSLCYPNATITSNPASAKGIIVTIELLNKSITPCGFYMAFLIPFSLLPQVENIMHIHLTQQNGFVRHYHSQSISTTRVYE